MTPDELRALANALEPMAKAPRFEDMDVPGFCAWLRACADEKPVGYATANGLRMLRQDDATVLLYPHDYLIRPDHVALYTHPAPAAPQAEPCIGNDPACPCQDGDACHYKDAADGTKAWPVPQAEPKRLRECAQRLVDGARWGLAGALSPSSKAREIPSSAWSDVKSRHLASLRDALAAPQAEPIADSDADYWLRNRQAILDAIERAGFVLMSNASGFWMHPRGATDAQAEPKREPLPGLAPTHRCPACGALWRQCDDSSWNLRSALCCGLCDAGRVELVRLLDEPKREPLSDESPKVEWLSTDDAETQLALAIRDAVKVAPSADDKALLYALNRRGIWLAWIGGSDAE